MQRKAILVLGMHRSGTSAFARVLSLLGCDLPRTLMGGWEGNPKGHWESTAIAALNDEILASAGSHWDDWLEFNPQWYDSPVSDAFGQRASDVLAEEFGTSPLFVLKDPRNCRLTRFWFNVLDQANVEPLVAIPLRNPIEVVDSLEKRNDMHRDVIKLLWLRHVLDAEQGSRGRRRVFSYYDELLDNWAKVAQHIQDALGVAWPRLSPRTAMEVESFLDQGSRHHIHSKQDVQSDPMLSSWVRDANDIFRKWSASGDDLNDYAVLDDIRQQLNAVGPVFAKLTYAVSNERYQKRELHTLLQAKEGEFARLQGESEEREASLVELRTAKDLVARDLRAAQEDFEKLQKESAERLHELENAQSALRQREEEIAQTLVSLDVERQHAVQAAAERRAADEGLAAVQEKLEKLLNESTERRHELGNVQSVLRQREEEIAQTLARLDVERQHAVQAVAERCAAEEELAAVQTKLAATDAWVFSLARERKIAEDRVALVESRLAATSRAFDLATIRLTNMERRQNIQSAENAKLVRQNEEVARLAETLRMEKEDVALRWASAQSEIVTLNKLLQQRDVDIAERQSEIAALASNLREKDADTHSLEWLQQINNVVTSYPHWWMFVPKRWRGKWQQRRLLRRGLFDAEAYLTRYPDVSTSGMDPLRHYIAHGIKENRRLE